MKSELKKILRDLEDWEFIELGHHMDLAQQVRDIMRIYHLSDVQLAAKMELRVQKVRLYANGTFDFTLMDIARVQAVSVALGQEAWTKKVENSEVIEYVHHDAAGVKDGQINISYEKKRKRAAKKKK